MFFFKTFANVIQLEYDKIICPSLKPLPIYFFYSEQKEGTVFDLWKRPRGELWLRSGHLPQDRGHRVTPFRNKPPSQSMTPSQK